MANINTVQPCGILCNNHKLSRCNEKRNIIQAIFKKRILVQDRGRGEYKTADILTNSEDLNFASNNDIRPKDFFEMVCRNTAALEHQDGYLNGFASGRRMWRRNR